MSESEVEFDFSRRSRIGLAEAVLCEGKSKTQIEHIVDLCLEKEHSLLLTRLSPGVFESLATRLRPSIDYDTVSRTGVIGTNREPWGGSSVAVVAAGTSDTNIVREATRTLAFYGVIADEIIDVGVAGLWRILDKREKLLQYRVLIVVAGMDGALFSVIGGLVGDVVIAVPTATGYGASNGGQTALNSALASCAPGIVAVNIGNGYGAACAALRILGGDRTSSSPSDA